MKKAVIIFSFLILFVKILSAQQNENKADYPKWLLSFGIGAAVPIGDYADSRGDNLSSGFATTGLNIQLINAARFFHPNMGVAIQWLGGTNEVDFSAVDRTVRELTGVNVSSNIEPYGYGGILVGPIVTVPFEGGNFDMRFLLGPSSGTVGYQEVTVNGYRDSENQYLFIDGDTKVALGYSFGAGLRFFVSNRIDLGVTVDHFMGRYDFMLDADDNGFDEVYPQTFTVINANVAIYWVF